MNETLPTLNSLRHISEVPPLSEADTPLVQELVQVLKKNNALDRFGITLLHRHFLFSDNEVLVETTDVEGRTQIIRPVSKETLRDKQYIETAWRLDTGQATLACVCMVEGGEHTGNHQHIPGR